MACWLKPYRQYTTVSIVGSAGRKDDKEKMSHDIFNKAVDKTIQVITEEFKITNMSRVHLVSGGAAWSDHIAVHLFINKIVPALTLHLPANWVSKPSPCFEDVKSSSNPGRTSNSCHKLFSKAIGRNSLAEIQQAISAGATVKIHDGFYARNKYVAMSDKLIAFTWGEDREKPTSGGTLHTWKHCKGDCKHIPYSTLASNADHDGTDPSIISSSNYVNPHKHTPASEHGYVTGKRKNSPHHIIGTNSEYNIEKKKQTTFKKGKQLSKTLSLEKVKIKNTVGGSCIVNEEDILQQFDGYDIFCSDNDNSYNDDSSI